MRPTYYSQLECRVSNSGSWKGGEFADVEIHTHRSSSCWEELALRNVKQCIQQLQVLNSVGHTSFSVSCISQRIKTVLQLQFLHINHLVGQAFQISIR